MLARVSSAASIAVEPVFGVASNTSRCSQKTSITPPASRSPCGCVNYSFTQGGESWNSTRYRLKCSLFGRIRCEQGGNKPHIAGRRRSWNKGHDPMATANLLDMTDKRTSDKQKALDSALAQIERQFGK